MPRLVLLTPEQYDLTVAGLVPGAGRASDVFSATFGGTAGFSTNADVLKLTAPHVGNLHEAAVALAQAAELAAGGAPERLPDIAGARADLAFAEQLDDIRYRKWAFVSDPGGTGHFNTKIAPPLYRKAFAGRDLDLAAFGPGVAARRIAGSPIKAELVAAVDDWALYEPDLALAARLAEANGATLGYRPALEGRPHAFVLTLGAPES